MATSIRLSEEAEERLDFLAADVLERVRQGKEAVYTSAQVRTDLGLDG